MNKKRKGNILFITYLLVLILPMLEISLRLVGYKPYQQNQFHIESKPDFCILPHSKLGFSLMPGSFEVTINDGLTFSLTHNSDSQRITSFSQDTLTKPEIFVMGCSYTYGFGNDDSLTYPFLLQKRLPQYRIKNWGVPGYGNVQSFLQLEKAISNGAIPEIVILNYADFHDDRNALTPKYRRDLHLGFLRSNEKVKEIMKPGQFPFLTEENGEYLIQKVAWENIYQTWRGSESWAIVNFFQIISDQISLLGKEKRDVSLAAFGRIKNICEENGIRLIVSGLTKNKNTADFLTLLREKEFETVDISLDLTHEKYNHLPYDSHPNEAAHAWFAEKIFEYLSETPTLLIDSRRDKPISYQQIFLSIPQNY